MDYEYWTKTINEEDRKINNANRRFRYHCNSLERNRKRDARWRRSFSTGNILP